MGYRVWDKMLGEANKVREIERKYENVREIVWCVEMIAEIDSRSVRFKYRAL